jgi:hypothetical protein
MVSPVTQTLAAAAVAVLEPAMMAALAALAL